MSQRNKNNSLIFITTLSVYLGLVLIGAPTVLTHAVLTKNFDIQSEIEVSDDLDNKPDKDELDGFGKIDFPILFAQFLNEIRAEVEAGKISLPLQTNFNVSGSFSRSHSSGSGGFNLNVSDQNLSVLIQNAINQKILPKAFELSDSDKESKNVNIKFEADKADLSLKISFGKSNAKQFAEFLERKFSVDAVSVKNALVKQIYENTTVAFVEREVVVLTRLPRGSLDAFLKQSAKVKK